MVGIITRNMEASVYASRVINRLHQAKKDGGRELPPYEEEICNLYDALSMSIVQEERRRGHANSDMNSKLGAASQKIYDEFRRFVGENLPHFNAELRKQMN